MKKWRRRSKSADRQSRNYAVSSTATIYPMYLYRFRDTIFYLCCPSPRIQSKWHWRFITSLCHRIARRSSQLDSMRKRIKGFPRWRRSPDTVELKKLVKICILYSGLKHQTKHRTRFYRVEQIKWIELMN